jgi:hypothetical protein
MCIRLAAALHEPVSQPAALHFEQRHYQLVHRYYWCADDIQHAHSAGEKMKTIAGSQSQHHFIKHSRLEDYLRSRDLSCPCENCLLMAFDGCKVSGAKWAIFRGAELRLA